MKTFWVVWQFMINVEGILYTQGSKNPNKLHLTEQAAKQEALRLAQQNPNQEFTVCQVTRCGKAKTAAAIYEEL